MFLESISLKRIISSVTDVIAPAIDSNTLDIPPMESIIPKIASPIAVTTPITASPTDVITPEMAFPTEVIIDANPSKLRKLLQLLFQPIL